MSRYEFLGPGQSSSLATEVEGLSSDIERETQASSDDGLTNFCPDPSSDTSGHTARKRPSSPSLTTDESSQTSKKLKTSTQTSEFRPEYVAGGRPKISDYVVIIEALLLCTMREYESFISATDAFPNGLTQGDWARACWRNTAKKTKKNFELTGRMEGLVRLSISNL